MGADGFLRGHFSGGFPRVVSGFPRPDSPVGFSVWVVGFPEGCVVGSIEGRVRPGGRGGARHE